MNLLGIIATSAEGTLTLSRTIEESMIIVLKAIQKLGTMRFDSIDEQSHIIIANTCPSSILSSTQKITIKIEPCGQTSCSIHILSENSIKKQKIDYGMNSQNVNNLTNAITSLSCNEYNQASVALSKIIHECKEKEKLQKSTANKRAAIVFLSCLAPLVIGIILRMTCECEREEQYTYWFFGDKVGTRMVSTSVGALSSLLCLMGGILLFFSLFILPYFLERKYKITKRHRK